VASIWPVRPDDGKQTVNSGNKTKNTNEEEHLRAVIVVE
jgi:hypothetical protein